MFDAQATIDPPEEQFDLPAQSINAGDHPGGDFQMVCQEGQIAPRRRIEVMHFPQRPRKGCARAREGQFADLVAAHSCRGVGWQGVMAGKPQVVFGADDKKSSRRRHPTETLKIHIATVHDVKSSRLQDQFVEPEHVVLTGVGHMNTSGNPRTLMFSMTP